MLRRSLMATLATLPFVRGLRAAEPVPDRRPEWAPNHPVRLVVPFAAGGSTDLTARLLAERLGAEAVARAAPDGHTLVLTTSTTHATNPALYRTLPFDVQRDFAPVSLIAFVPNLLVVRPSLGADSVDALIALALRRPGALNYGSAGAGSSQHLAAALFASRAGLDLAHVPYRGGSQALLDLLSDKIDLMFSPLVEVLPHVQTGRLLAMGITTASRSALLPNVPTVAERLPGYEVRLWNGVLAPAATPRAAVERLSRECAAVLRTDEMRHRLAQGGSEPVGSTPEEFADFIAAELPRWAELVRISGARVD